MDAFQTILQHELSKVQGRLEEFAEHMKKLNVDDVNMFILNYNQMFGGFLEHMSKKERN